MQAQTFQRKERLSSPVFLWLCSLPFLPESEGGSTDCPRYKIPRQEHPLGLGDPERRLSRGSLRLLPLKRDELQSLKHIPISDQGAYDV